MWPTSGIRAQDGAAQPQVPIEKLLSEGQTLMVQVVKDPIGTKGARLSTQVTIAGRAAGLPAAGPHIGISQQIDDEAEREASAREAAAADSARRDRRLHRAHRWRRMRPTTNLLADVEYLRKMWSDDRAQAAQTAAPTALLYQDLNLAQRVLRDFVNDETAAHPSRFARDLPSMQDSRPSSRRRAAERLQHYAASGRSSTCTASKTRSSVLSRGAWI